MVLVKVGSVEPGARTRSSNGAPWFSWSKLARIFILSPFEIPRARIHAFSDNSFDIESASPMPIFIMIELMTPARLPYMNPVTSSENIPAGHTQGVTEVAVEIRRRD